MRKSDILNRRDFLKAIGYTTASLAMPGCMSRAAQLGRARGQGPNILFILADDLGWGDVSWHGSKIICPNLDALAEQAVRLEQHYVHPVCSPTRAALLSGRYPSRYGLLTPTNEQVFPFGTVTLASALRDSGYNTCISGKWHLGSKPEWGPLKYGFNRSYGCLAGGIGQYNHRYKKGPYTHTWHRNDRLLNEQGHSTELFTREAISWIEKERQPFFLYIPFTAVHIPVEVPQRWVELYEGMRFYDDPVKDESYKRFAAYVTHMDNAIGRIVEALSRTGQREDTLIIFTSDNGAQQSWKPSGRYPGTFQASPVLGSNLPLRGYKAQLYEGGIRVPTFANWPSVLKPCELTEPVHIVDWMPTLTRLAGYKPKQNLDWDGRDIWPLLTGELANAEARSLYWKFFRGLSAIRHGDWKLVVWQDEGKQELYNLAADPYEKQDVAEKYPKKVAELKALLAVEQGRDC